MAKPSYDSSLWPIFSARMPPSGLNDDEFAAHLELLKGYLTKGQRFALLIDARGSKPLTAGQRQTLARVLVTAHERDPRVLAGVGIVLTSAIERGVLTAITWIAGPIYPMRAFSNTDDAVAWLRQLWRSDAANRTQHKTQASSRD